MLVIAGGLVHSVSASRGEPRDIVQNIYLGKVEKVNGQLYTIQFATFEAVKDPLKMKK